MSMMFQRPSREFAPRAPALRSFFLEKMSRKKISQNELFYSLETIKTKKSDIFTKTKTFGRELTALDAI